VLVLSSSSSRARSKRVINQSRCVWCSRPSCCAYATPHTQIWCTLWFILPPWFLVSRRARPCASSLLAQNTNKDDDSPFLFDAVGGPAWHIYLLFLFSAAMSLKSHALFSLVLKVFSRCICSWLKFADSQSFFSSLFLAEFVCVCIAEQPNHLAEGLKPVNLT